MELPSDRDPDFVLATSTARNSFTKLTTIPLSEEASPASSVRVEGAVLKRCDEQ